MSAYVFVFRLPYLLAILPGVPGDFWMFRYLNAVSENINPSRPIPGAAGFDLLASSIGPSLIQISQTANEGDMVLEYPTSVKSRATNGGWYEKIRLYREGLAFLPWEKSLETLWELNSLQQTSPSSRHRSGSLAGIFETEPPGSLRNPTTVIWGKEDHALSHTLCLEGIEDYFAVHGSNVVMLSNCGHWVPLSKHGVDAWQEVVHWAVTGEKESLKQRLDDYPLAKVVLEA
jgi:pimeloyl-ACP methyl ester carboxylesterase